MPVKEKEEAKAKIPEKIEETPKGKIKPIMVLAGGFLLSFAVVFAGMYFVLKSMQPPITSSTSEETTVAESASNAADTISANTKVMDSQALPAVVIPDIDLTQYGLPASGMIPADSVKVAIDRILRDRNEANEKLAETEQNLAEKERKADSLQQELAALLKKRDSLDMKSITRLAKIFESMKATEAAPVISELSDEVTVVILMKMKERPAAKILSEMPVSRAAAISRLISQKVLEG